jgi:hypothetical protein
MGVGGSAITHRHMRSLRSANNRIIHKQRRRKKHIAAYECHAGE